MKNMFLLLVACMLTIAASAGTISLKLDDIHSIRLLSGIKVNLKQGPKQEITVTGDDNLISTLNQQVTNGEWEIRFASRSNKDFGGVTVDITLPIITNIEVGGSGSLKGIGTIKTDDISLKISGSGNMELALDAKNVSSMIAGSGSINLSGNSQKHGINISGSGFVRSEKLQATDVVAQIAGSGSAYVHATVAMVVDISGSGNVLYKGDPRQKVSVNGSGKVSKL